MQSKIQVSHFSRAPEIGGCKNACPILKSGTPFFRPQLFESRKWSNMAQIRLRANISEFNFKNHIARKIIRKRTNRALSAYKNPIKSLETTLPDLPVNSSETTQSKVKLEKLPRPQTRTSNSLDIYRRRARYQANSLSIDKFRHEFKTFDGIERRLARVM
jgi:hypothetical protein